MLASFHSVATLQNLIDILQSLQSDCASTMPLSLRNPGDILSGRYDFDVFKQLSWSDTSFKVMSIESSPSSNIIMSYILAYKVDASRKNH